nr:leucine-rich repeat domain-containing protein [Eubacterium sp.]
ETYTYTSSNTSVVKVDSEGNVKAKKAGTAYIKVQGNTSGKYVLLNVYIYNTGASVVGNYSYTYDGTTKTAEFIGIASGASVSNVVIPAKVTINGIKYKVTSVAAKALYHETAVTSITIGKNVSSIGKKAFALCTSLKTVTVKTTKSSLYLNKKIFYKDSKLRKITLKKKNKSTLKKTFYKAVKNSKLKTSKVKIK